MGARAFARRALAESAGGAAAWDYGVDPDVLQELADYMSGDFDWRAVETRPNALPQFRVEVDGIGVHFFYHRSGQAGAPTVVLIHGWPGSFLAFPAAADRLVAAGIDVVRWTEQPAGGHFAAMEQPALFADDVAAFVKGVG